MITLNVTVWFVVLVTLVAGLAWFFALPEWRRLRAPQRLEELRCAACATAEDCRHRLAAGAAAPPKDCPNDWLFKSAD